MKRTCLVVGHSSGIGLALTRMALDAGHAVVGLSRRASGIATPSLSERQADVLDVDFASVELPAALDGVAYCPGSLNLKAFRALREKDFLDEHSPHRATSFERGASAGEPGSSPAAPSGAARRRRRDRVLPARRTSSVDHGAGLGSGRRHVIRANVTAAPNSTTTGWLDVTSGTRRPLSGHRAPADTETESEHAECG